MARNTQNRRSVKTREYAPPTYIAYHVEERDEDQSFWTRIGAAWVHDDGEGLTVRLSLMPVKGGKIVLRTRKDEEDAAKEGTAG